MDRLPVRVSGLDVFMAIADKILLDENHYEGERG